MPLSSQPFNNWIFFLIISPFPEINPVWAIDAVWPFGCNLHFLLIIFFYNHPTILWGGVGGPWNFYPNPGSPALGNQMGATENHLSQFTERACVGISHCHGPLMHAPRAQWSCNRRRSFREEAAKNKRQRDGIGCSVLKGGGSVASGLVTNR